MDIAKFWDLIQQTHDASNGDMDGKCAAIHAALSQLTKSDATEFARIFDGEMARAYSWPLWGAAFVIGGGCGDDTFTDFRASLISRGQVAFEKALSDPDPLAEENFDEEGWFYEGYQYAVTEGVEAAAGGRVDRQSHQPGTPTGAEWTEDNVYTQFPRLALKFGG